MIEKDIFKKSIIVKEKCLSYGFKEENEELTYQKKIENSFLITVSIRNNKVTGKVIDTEIGEEYTNYRIEKETGEFVSTIREAFINTLIDIREHCTIQNNFISNQANRISAWIKDTYHDSPEYLWDDDKNAVFRNDQNKKWYGIVMYINQNKIDDKDQMVEVMNIKLPPEKIDELVKKEGFYRAYHMNKKYWITFTLDDRVPDQEIQELIKISYQYTIETKDWVVPANPKYWDIIHCFDEKDEIDWKEVRGIECNDYLYIYVGSPYSCILYKCQVLEKNIPSPYPGFDMAMRIKLVKRYRQDEYTFDKVKEYDLRAIRGPRRMPNRLLKKMEKDEHEKNI